MSQSKNSPPAIWRVSHCNLSVRHLVQKVFDILSLTFKSIQSLLFCHLFDAVDLLLTTPSTGWLFFKAVEFRIITVWVKIVVGWNNYWGWVVEFANLARMFFLDVWNCELVVLAHVSVLLLLLWLQLPIDKKWCYLQSWSFPSETLMNGPVHQRSWSCHPFLSRHFWKWRREGYLSTLRREPLPPCWTFEARADRSLEDLTLTHWLFSFEQL